MSCLKSCQTAQHLGSYEIRKYLQNFNFGLTHRLVLSLKSRNQTLEIAINKHAKKDTKLFFSCPVLMVFSILFQIFCPGLSDPAKFWSQISPVFFRTAIFLKAFFLIFNKNIKQVSKVKVLNLMVLCKRYFAYLIQVKNSILKSFQIAHCQFFDRTNFFQQTERAQ